MSTKVRGPRDPALQSLNRTIQNLKLLLAAQMATEESAGVMATELVQSRDEAVAIGRYLLAETRGEGERFRKQERELWRHVQAVYARAPSEAGSEDS